MHYIDRQRLAFMRCGQTGYNFGRDFTGGDSRQESTANDNRTVNDLSGGGVQANAGSTIQLLSTDNGAVSRAVDLGAYALAVNNAGVQTVTNALVQGQRHLLDSTMGTTRDVIEVADSLGREANNSARIINRDSIDLARYAITTVDDGAGDALDFARLNVSDVFRTVGDALDFATNSLSSSAAAQRNASSSISEAFTTAKDSADGNRTLILAAFGLLGIVAAGLALRK